MADLLHPAQVKDFARVADSIIGWGSSVGRWARIDNKSVIGEDVHVKARLIRPPIHCLFPPKETPTQPPIRRLLCFHRQHVACSASMKQIWC